MPRKYCNCGRYRSQNIKNPHIGLWKVFRHMVIGLLIILFLLETYQAWGKYAKKDRMMISELQEPEVQIFPGVTLCKGIIPEKFNGDVKLELERSKNLDTWIEFSVFNNVDQDFPPSPNSKWQYRNTSKYTTCGFPNGLVCHTYTAPEEAVPGINRGLTMGIKAKESDFIFVVLHDSNQNIPTAQDIFGNAVASLRAPEGAGKRLLTDLAVDTVRTVRLGTEDVPCNPDRTVDPSSRLQECLESKFEEKAGCSLPWNLDNRSGRKVCSNDTQMHDFEGYLTEMIEKASFTNIYKKTGCIHSCDQMTYTYKIPFELTIPSDNDVTIFLQIFLMPNGVTYRKEVVVFDALEMIGNVGGYMGLLLGWSVLSIFSAAWQTLENSFPK